MNKNSIDLNFNYGRTKDELKEKGMYLYKYIKKEGNPLNITFSECVYMVKFRTIAETWNGIIQREINTINNLKLKFPELKFIKTSGKIDSDYEVDYEVFFNNKLILGLQIKPQSYKKGLTEEIVKTKIINQIKNKEYFNRFGVNTIYIFSKANGEILNKEVISTIEYFKNFSQIIC